MNFPIAILKILQKRRRTNDDFSHIKDSLNQIEYKYPEIRRKSYTFENVVSDWNTLQKRWIGCAEGPQQERKPTWIFSRENFVKWNNEKRGMSLPDWTIWGVWLGGMGKSRLLWMWKRWEKSSTRKLKEEIDWVRSREAYAPYTDSSEYAIYRNKSSSWWSWN